MIYVILGLSLIFILLGFVLTENNAGQILAGFNSMSEEEKKKVDLKAYIPYFRKFHIFLGLSILAIGSFVFYSTDESSLRIFLILYILLSYLFFVLYGSRYYKGGMKKA